MLWLQTVLTLTVTPWSVGSLSLTFALLTVL
jgi:hypothetical protein